MAIAHIVDDSAMTRLAITARCSRRRMVRARGMADSTIFHDRGMRIMAVQATVDGVRATVAVCIGKRNKRTRRNRLVNQQMVAVWNTIAVTNTAVSLLHVAYVDIIHTEVLVYRRSWDICQANTDKKHASDNNQE